MKKFEGKVVLVTGAGHGIGKQIAVQFAEQGANTVIVDYNVEFGTETAEEITRDYVKSLFCLLYTSLCNRHSQTCTLCFMSPGTICPAIGFIYFFQKIL